MVAAIHAGKLPRSDARPFCNQLAWLMSGRDADYTGIFDEAEVNRYECRCFLFVAFFFRVYPLLLRNVGHERGSLCMYNLKCCTVEEECIQPCEMITVFVLRQSPFDLCCRVFEMQRTRALQLVTAPASTHGDRLGMPFARVLFQPWVSTWLWWLRECLCVTGRQCGGQGAFKTV